MQFVNIFLLVIAFILLIVGLAGCLLPVIPGPPLSFLGVCLLHFSEFVHFSTEFFLAFGILTVIITVLDYLLPIWGTKKFGGSKFGIWGSAIGLILGLIFFPPLGIIVGPFLGALAGELLSSKRFGSALKASFGSFIGFLFGTVTKLVISGLMLFYSVKYVIVQ